MAILFSQHEQNLLKKRQFQRKQRFIFIIAALGIFALSCALILYGLRNSVSFFRTPSELTKDDKISHQTIRLGGFVLKKSVRHLKDNTIAFILTDFKKDVKITYSGALPNLFREGQTIIAEGKFRKDGNFNAQRLLAKHDEKYMTPQTEKRLKDMGLWKDYQDNAN